MKNGWKILAGRIDALSLRERAFLFVSVLLSCLVLADTFWLSPAQIRQKQVEASVKQQSGELQVLREQLRTNMLSPPATDAGQAARSELVLIQSRLESVNRDIARVSSLAGESVQLSKVLVHFLRRHEGLTLERAVTLAAEAPATKPAPSGATAGAIISLPRQGMEITVSGSYLELMRYVQTLEQALPALRWGRMRLSSGKSSPQLTLRVFLVGGAP